MKATLVASIAVLVLAPAAQAGLIVQWQISDGGNGHFFEFVDANSTWALAKSSAEAMTHLGMLGHLATVTSDAENQFLFSSVLLTSAFDVGAWIGLTDDEAYGVRNHSGSHILSSTDGLG